MWQDVLVGVLVFVMFSSGGLCSGGVPPCLADFRCVVCVRAFCITVVTRRLVLPVGFRRACSKLADSSALQASRGGACALRECYYSSSTLGFTVTASRISASIAAIL